MKEAGVYNKGVSISMKIDTESAVSLVSRKAWGNRIVEIALTARSVPSFSRRGHWQTSALAAPAKRIRQTQYTCIGGRVVPPGDGPSLFGRNWLNDI